MAENEDKKTEKPEDQLAKPAVKKETAAAAKKAKAEAKPAEKKAAAKPAKKKSAEAAEAGKSEAKKAAKPKKKKKVSAPKAVINPPVVKVLDIKDAGLNPDVFEIEPKIGVLHEVARAEMAAMRQGNASTKRRGEVSGGGVKPWRQKGTGRARAGSSRMPHWTGGGITFGPKPRDYKFKVNRKTRSKALKMALSARVKEGGLKVVDNLTFPKAKTAAAAALLRDLDVAYPLLVLIDEEETNAILAFRNLPRVGVTVTSEIEINDIMGARMVLTTSGAVEKLNNRLAAK